MATSQGCFKPTAPEPPNPVEDPFEPHLKIEMFAIPNNRGSR